MIRLNLPVAEWLAGVLHGRTRSPPEAVRQAACAPRSLLLVRSVNKHAGSQQFAALPVRKARGGVREVLLVTSRETRRWIIPKGWPMVGLSGAEVAQVEAFEEAGIRGKATRKPIGHYDYWKRLGETFRLVRVDVFRMKVTRLLKSWPEADSRARAWFPLEKAAEMVEEPGLRAILSDMHLARSGKSGADGD